jgi:hypothetical protein
LETGWQKRRDTASPACLIFSGFPGRELKPQSFGW